MKELLIPTREKLTMLFYFLAVALSVAIAHIVLARMLFSGRDPQEGAYIAKNISPFVSALFTLLQYYLLTCVAVAMLKKSK